MLSCTGFAILAVGASGNKQSLANFTVPFLCIRIQNILIEIFVCGHHRIAEPFAEQGIAVPLGADVAEGPVRCNAAALLEITAMLLD